MATTGNPLGIGLSIDFARLDTDLSKVADRIDKVGAETMLRVGTLSALAKDSVNTDQLSSQMGRVGASLQGGMVSAVSATNALMLKMTAQIAATLDKLAGVTIATFTRIDAAMRFPFLDSSLSNIHTRLRNIWSGAGKDLNALDIAMGGGFGRIGAKVAKVASVLFADLGQKISGPIIEGIAKIVPAIEEMANRMVQAMEAASRSMFRSVSTAMDGIGDRFKGMKVIAGQSGEASAVALMKGFQAKSSGLRTAALAEFTKGKEEPIDVASKIKPLSETAIKKFFAGFKDIGATQLKAIFEKPPPKQEFKGRIAEPQLGKGFFDVGKQGLQAISTGIATARQKLAEFSKAGYTVDQMLTKVAASFGGWGVAIAVPLAGFVTLGSAVVRTTSFIVDMGVLAVRTFHSMGNFLTSIGSVGKKSFADLYQSHGIFAGSVLGGVKVVSMLASGLRDLVTGRAFRRVGDDAKQFGGAVQTATGFMGKLTSSVGRLGVEMAAAFGLVGLVYKVVQFFEKGVKSAADLNAEVARSKVVFGESFGPVAAQIEKNTKAFKISKSAQMEVTSAFGSMAQGAGVSEAKSADLATELNSLAIDMTGLGVSFADSSEAIKTGLSGRAISLKQFAVNIDENTTKAFAWKTGIAAVGQELTMQETLLARAGQITRGLSYAQGTLTGESKALADQSGKLAEQIDKVGTSLRRVGAVPKPKTAKPDVLGTQAERDQIKVENAAKASAAAIERAAIAARNATKGANLEKAKQDMRANQESARSAGLAAIDARKKWRQGLLAGPIPELPKPAQLKKLPEIKKPEVGLAKKPEVAEVGKAVETAAVQFRMAGGGVQIFAEKIGELLLPAVNSATKGFNALLGGVLNLVERAGPTLQSWATDSSAVVDTFIAKTQEFGPTILENLTWAWAEAKKGPLGFVIEGTEAVINFAKAIPEAIGIAVRNMGTLWEIAKLEVGAFVTNAMATIRTIPGNFGIIFPWILKNWRTLLADLVEALKTIGGNLLENARNLGSAIWEALKGGEFKFEWTPLLDGFKATTEQLPDLIKPDLISVGDEVNKLYRKIGEDELNLKKKTQTDAAAMSGKKPPILPEDKSKEYKLGGALEQGTKEAFSAISKGQAGRSSTTDAVKQGVAVQKDIHKAINQQTEVIKNKAFTPALSVK